LDFTNHWRHYMRGRACVDSLRRPKTNLLVRPIYFSIFLIIVATLELSFLDFVIG
jgi:hypothetical protein